MFTAHAEQKVVALTEPNFGFDSDGPVYSFGHSGMYPRQQKVDPAPGYSHDRAIVDHEFAHLRSVAPLPIPLAVVTLGHEVVSRTNGHFEQGWNHQAEAVNGKYPPVGTIVLSGKRIPPHPAMTRYLVAHEYGHAVEFVLAPELGLNDGEARQQYLETCRPDAKRSYGCGHWHSNIGEMFANDFRILIAQREVEWWPHEGFARPEGVPKVVDFWNDIKRRFWTN